MDTNRLSTEILNDISTCISGDYDNVHETGFIRALRMGDAADADMLSVNKSQHVEDPLCVLLAALLEFQTPKTEIELRILSDNILLPSFTLICETGLLDYVILALRVMDYRSPSLLIYIEFA